MVFRPVQFVEHYLTIAIQTVDSEGIQTLDIALQALTTKLPHQQLQLLGWNKFSKNIQ